MKLKNIIGICIICILLTSCAKNIVLNYGQPSETTGNIVIRPTTPVQANFTFNDSLCVKYKYVKTITIKNAPIGIHTIHFSADSHILKDAMDKKIEVDISAGKTKTYLITTPPKSNGYWIYNTFSMVSFLAFYVYVINMP